MIKYKNLKDNRLSIFKNILINNNIITAYYVLFPFNYSIMDMNSAGRHIDQLYNSISNLYSSLGEIKMSMFKLKNIVSREETISSIIKTVRMYDDDYNDMPIEYKRFIKNITRDFSILAIQIDVKNSFDIEKEDFKSIIKGIIDNFITENFSMNNVKINQEAVLSQNLRIRNILQRYAVPADSKLVMNIYINSLFPSYNLVYNNYLVDKSTPILGGVQQEIIPHLGWFEMSNSGIISFGGIPRTTYGSIITILEFPEQIMTENFNINMPGLHVNMHLLPKDKAMLKLKRMRADVKQELEEADEANATDTDIDENVELAQRAIDDLRRGRIATELDANILVIANSLEELERKKKHVISVLSDISVVCSIHPDQGKAFVDSFIKNNPKDYYHLLDLQFALSFQIDDGVLVGDQDSRFASPVIGVS